MASVNRMSEEQAKVEIKKRGLVYNSTVTLSAATALGLAARAVAIEEIKPNTRVDLVTDKTGRGLFFIPAAAEEKVDVSGLRKEMAEIQKKNAAALKKTETAYQKRLDEMNKVIKELQKKIG
jgi:succinate dehydrogenase/fumarate reductase flavoprotein subunit